MDIADVRNKAILFQTELNNQKALIAPPDFPWYPYETLSNFNILDALLTGENRSIFDRLGNDPIADIGAADGDLAFFLETLGHKVEIIDNGPTNMNGLRGARLMRDARKSTVEIHEADLDAHFDLPQNSYSVVFFLGILYHLKSPYYALESLAKRAKHCFISTKITKFAADKTTDLSQIPAAYLLAPDEANNDPTNYWILSDAGFRRLLDRTGWEILDYRHFGNTVDSDPATPAGDERAFCLVKSRLVR